MSAPPCPRLFEVEALRDGRLAGAERQSFQRHLETCAACSDEARALDALGQSLRAATAEDDELRVRRERTRLLAAFDSTLVETERHRAPKRSFLLFGVAAVLMVLGLAIWQAAPLQKGTATPAIVVQADEAARWTRTSRADSEVVKLESGTVHVRVHRGAPQPALVVELPDGELRDIGTTFSVSVHRGRTRRVAVDEGRVLLELRGRKPVIVDAGQTWVPQPAAPHALGQPAPRPAAPPSPSQAKPPAPEPRAASLAPATSAAPLGSDAPNAAAAEFRAAMSALSAGQARVAALGFQRFIARYPGDPRAEDAAYLRVLALERAGDLDARRAAARSYLERYPAGFRRAEVEQLVR